MTEESVPYNVAVHEAKDWRKHPLMFFLREPIQVHRILIDLTGSLTAALMASKIVNWMPSAKRPDAYVYKTVADWTQETGMSRYEQEGARTTLQKFEWWEEQLLKANGAPTVHYRVNLDLLERDLSILVTKGLGEIPLIDPISGKTPNGLAEIPRIHKRKKRESITTRTTTRATTGTTNISSSNKSSTKDTSINSLDQDVDFYASADARKEKKKNDQEEGLDRATPSLSQAEPDKVEEKKEPPRDPDKEFDAIPGAVEQKP